MVCRRATNCNGMICKDKISAATGRVMFGAKLQTVMEHRQELYNYKRLLRTGVFIFSFWGFRLCMCITANND